MHHAMITVRNLMKRYDKIIALNNVTFTFNESHVTAIMGENGAGKTTLLRICAGIIPFDSGEVYIDGFSIVNDSIAARERLGYLPEMPYMYDRLTGREFLFYIASLRKMTTAKNTIEELAHLLGIAHFMDHEIGTYSKGMKQKISLIAAIMHEPNNLLLDEPVWGLDPLTSRTLQKFIKERKGTTIFATHSPQLVETIADTVYILKRGTVISSGSVSTMMKQYGTIEEAYFHSEDETNA
jgi:ABC-2 type transport system ATP-binding protein